MEPGLKKLEVSLADGIQHQPRLTCMSPAANTVTPNMNCNHETQITGVEQEPRNAAPPAVGGGPPGRTSGNASAAKPAPQKPTNTHTAEVYIAGAGPGDQYKVGHFPDFDAIKEMCEHDIMDCRVDMSPHAFAYHRQVSWPQFTTLDSSHPAAHLIPIYEAVAGSGIPNCMGARIPIPSALKLDNWTKNLDGSRDEAEMFDMIKYGFPWGIWAQFRTLNPFLTTAVPSNTRNTYRGAIVGPFLAPPFSPWAHVSPLMSRPKGNTDEQRIITDLTYPPDTSVNAYIFKNAALGGIREHSLPTVSDIVADLQDMGAGSYMFTVDVARAYKNFRLDLLDWPLACTQWEGRYYLDVAMPFGARSSSSNMQRIANFIVRVLGQEGISAKMYLDDLIVVAPTYKEAASQYVRVQELFSELGLPEARDKTQPPATKITWLGIQICSVSMSLSIPQEKLEAALGAARSCRDKKTIHRRQLESLIGRLIHIAKCVEPACIFISRLLQALRDMKGWVTSVTTDMRSDIEWFLEFAIGWNGTALIPGKNPSKCIQVDASLTGIGETDGCSAYGGRVFPDVDPAANITQLEAANVIVALHTFLSEADRGSHVLLQCDNLPAVQALRWGRARNRVLMEVARMGWMVQALLDIKITFAHIAGVDNTTADRLSRAHSNPGEAIKADNILSRKGIRLINPCLHVFTNASSSVKSRSGVQLVGDAGRGQAARGQGSRDEGELPGQRQGPGWVLLPLHDGTPST